MKPLRPWHLLACFAAAPLAFAQPADDPDEPDDQEVFELSPFSVTGDEDVGYQATSTLAGTRLKTNLRDIGSSISIVNEQFLQDTGATNLEDVLVLTPNTEIGGLSGNFSATQYAGAGNIIPEGHRDNPSGGFTRIRGLAAADLTRNYFLTNVPFDTYNTDRIAVQRGANAALFGLGSPGGIVNATTVRANFSGNEGRVRLETDQYGTLRSSLRYNHEVLDDRLAIFVAGLYDKTKFEQEEAFSDDKRFYLSVTGKLTDSIRAHVSIEKGVRVSARPDFVPPNDGITPWLLAGKPVVDNPYEGAALFRGTGDFFPAEAANSTNSRLLSVDAAGTSSGFVHYYYDVNNPNPTFSGTPFVRADRGTVGNAELMMIRVRPMIRTMKLTGGWFPGGRTVDPGVAPLFSGGFVDQQITDRSIYDYREHLFSGGSSQQGSDFRVWEASLEGSWWDDKIGLELAYADQNFHSWGFNALQGIEARTIYIDMNRSLMQQDSAGNWLPNPNFGEPTMGGVYQGNWLTDDREAMRATAFIELRAQDFMDEDNWITKALGRLRITGVLSENTYNGEENYGGRGGVDPQTTADAIAGGDIFALSNATYRTGMQFALPYDSAVDFLSANSLADVRGANIGGVPHGESRDRPPSPSTFVGWDSVSQGFVSFTTPVYTLRDNNSFLSSFFSGKEEVEVDSKVLVGQYYIWEDTIVLTGTWRNDRQKSGSIGADAWKPYGQGEDDPALGNHEDTLDPEYIAGVKELSLDADEDTTSWGIMVHTPQFIRRHLPAGTEFSVYKSEADNFQPTGGNVNIFNEQVAPVTGSTEEMGFIVSTFDGKLNARFNWFDTGVLNRRYDVGGVSASEGILRGLVEQIDNPANVAQGFTAADAQAVLPPAGVQAVNGFSANWEDGIATLSRNSGDTGTQDFTAEGMEIEISYNPTRNWTMLLTIARQETVTSNTYPVMQRYVEDFVIPNWVESSFAQNYFIDDLGTMTLATQATNAIVIPVQKALLNDGNPAIEQREWRVNFNTSYNFGRNNDLLPDWVGDLTIGGGVRWEDEVGISFGASVNEFGEWALDPDKPFYGPSQTFVDVFARSTWELSADHDFTLQINIKDLFDNDDLVPFYANPDGSKLYRFLEGRLVTLSGTVSF